LAAIERFLRARGTSLKEHGLTFDFETSSELDEEIQHFGPRHHELSERSISMRETLNVDQQTVYGTLLRAFQALQNPDSNEEEAQINFYYIDGKAGRGKSYVAKIFVDELRSSGHVVIVVGTTALSITDYERGRTAHSTFKVPIRQVSKCQLFNP
jgi:chromosomal replication initiation ATPase DnaA